MTSPEDALIPAPVDIRPSACVYCGSRPGARPEFIALAEGLGAALANAKIRLVYGAGDLGLMGAVSNGCRAAGGETLGVIPEALWRCEIQDRSSSDIVVTENLQQRKTLMLANAQAAIVLPGGVGTLDEFIEAATWRHLGLHAKPIILLDPDGYWTPLMEMFERMRSEGFLWSDFAPAADSATESAFAVARSVEETIKLVRAAV